MKLNWTPNKRGIRRIQGGWAVVGQRIDERGDSLAAVLMHGPYHGSGAKLRAIRMAGTNELI